MKNQIQLLKIVIDFLDGLSEEQLRMIATKKTRLTLETENTTKKEIKSLPICVDEICEKMEAFSTREEAMEYITNLGLLKSELKAIAQKYNLPIGSKDTNTQIIDKIIENVVGSRLKFDALLKTNLKG